MRDERGRERPRRDLETEPQAASCDEEAEHPVGGETDERHCREHGRQAAFGEQRQVPIVEGDLPERDGGRREQCHVAGNQARPLAHPGGGETRADRHRGGGEDEKERLASQARRLEDPEEAVHDGERQAERHPAAEHEAEPRACDAADRQVESRDLRRDPRGHEATRRPVERRFDRPPDGAGREAGDAPPQHAVPTHSPGPNR